MSHSIGYRFSRPRADRKTTRRTLIDFPSPTPQLTPCRLWQGNAQTMGYGLTWDRDRQRMILAHRWIWEQVNGKTDLHILHRCDNPLCYRYDHLFAGTAMDNMRDMMRKGRGGGQFKPGATPNVKLNPGSVVLIRSRLDAGESMSEIARDYDVNRTTILAIRERRNWKSVA